MKIKKKIKPTRASLWDMSQRTQFLKIVFIICIFGILGRLLFLHFSERHFLRQVAENLHERTEKKTVLRGIITDREGTVIALSTPMYDVWINPQYFNLTHASWPRVAKLLELDTEKVQETLKTKKAAYFAYLKRHVSPQVWKEVKALKVPGLHADMEQERFYPDGEVLAHVLGFVNIDGAGQEGLELEYDRWLAGQSGQEIIQQDLLGNWIGPPLESALAEQGKPIALSLDRRVQFLVYQSLKEGVIKNNANSGSAIVMDLETGEILAMANWPSFNPNDRLSLQSGERKNRSVVDIFEPGSVIKSFTALAALKEGAFKLTDPIDTSPGYVKMGRNIVRDDEDYGILTLEQVLQKSSNVGISYVVTHIHPESLSHFLKDLGFGRSVNLHFPGEAVGTLPRKKELSSFELSTLSFGYGMSCSLLQLVQAYAVIGNGGLLRQPTLLRVKEPMRSVRVLDETLAREMLQALTLVVQRGGTAERGNLENYRISAKTGTAHKAIKGGYAARSYRSTFIGIAPVSHPKLIMAVMLDEPKGKEYYAGLIAAPIFKDAMEQILPLLNILPDREIEKKPHKI